MRTVTGKRAFTGLLLCLLLQTTVYAVEPLGADLAAPSVTSFLKTIPIQPGAHHVFTPNETERFIDLAAEIHINLFEALDCAFRYIKPLNARITINGADLRRLQSRYDLGGDRVLAIISVDKLRFLETGATLSAGQCDLDIYLESPTEKYIEIGTALYESRFGFRKLSPLLFDGAYGITVKKMIITTTLEKLELFAPGKGAIYVKALGRPKRWNLKIVSKF